MTERDLFRCFYAIVRMTEGAEYGSEPFAEEQEVLAVAAAVRAGLDDYSILGMKHAAALALEERRKQRAEPSRRSAAIQSMVFTFGRVTRGCA